MDLKEDLEVEENIRGNARCHALVFFSLQFRYAGWLDRLYMLVGTLAAIIHGVALPLMMLVFGDMTDTFANVGNMPPNFTDESKYCLWY